MKKYINRNFFWADLFAKQVYTLGVKHICISPGSRSTPLTMAFAHNKSFKKHIHIDERSSGFFALGIAKLTNQPVVVVTTSGTAVAELYPAIVEAFIQRIPLIICTADRPDYLRNTGANQTINQDNIFKNHIRYFYDCGLPEISKLKLKKFTKNVEQGLHIANEIDSGPIHFNFQFKKPLEPNSFTDEVNLKLNDFIVKSDVAVNSQKPVNKIKEVLSLFEQSNNPLLYCGWDNYGKNFVKIISAVSKKFNIPILTDGTTNLRFSKSKNELFLANQTSYINEVKTEPDAIIQFGNAPTSQAMLNYFENSRASRFLINKFGDLKDPSKRKGNLIKIDPIEFLNILKNNLTRSNNWKKWANYLRAVDDIAEEDKNILQKAVYRSEPRIISELLKSLPENSNLFISNSLPIRDFDLFASKVKKDLNIYVNRGASGIDGIISTASGLAAVSAKPTYLIIGDLAFYHNVSALATLAQNKIPLTIILVNNNGGGIFKLLPIVEDNKYFDEYFNTPLNLNFSKITKAFGGNYYFPEDWKDFERNIKATTTNKIYSVIEIKSDPILSVNLRKEYLAKVSKSIRNFDANSN